MSNTVLDKKIVHSHNKKRNVGLIYEFLVRNMTKNIVEGNNTAAAVSLDVLKRHFNKSSELYKEFRLLNSLFATTVSNKAVAANIVAEARNLAISHKAKKLSKEKSLLIKDINYNINEQKFYKQNVNNYKMYATIHNAIQCWRVPSADNLQKLAKYEDQIVSWLVTPKDVQPITEEYSDANNFIVQLMSKKIKEKYINAFSQQQNVLLNEYIVAGDNKQKKDQLKNKFLSIKENTMQLIEKYVTEQKQDRYLVEKLKVVTDKIQNISEISVNSSNLNLMLILTKLNEELSSEI
tara:strand:+ start:3145 stop:4023 length:879 start_codon:yes stop_codon:yes gene_type:complete